MELTPKNVKVYLYFYADSVGFPRLDQTPDVTWPFLLKDLLERYCNVSVYPYMRGLAGGRIKDIERIFKRDGKYFKAQNENAFSFVIYNIGVVDAAPRPFTYHLYHLHKFAKLPQVGRYISYFLSKILHPNRRLFQNIYSFRLTAPGNFRKRFDRMVRDSNKAGIHPISIDTPLTPVSLEDRSPGLRQSIDLYNSLKHLNTTVLHVPMDWVNDEHYLECGHHFSEAGHQELARRLYIIIRDVMNA
jgi:hypothetical protein